MIGILERSNHRGSCKERHFADVGRGHQTSYNFTSLTVSCTFVAIWQQFRHGSWKEEGTATHFTGRQFQWQVYCARGCVGVSVCLCVCVYLHLSASLCASVSLCVSVSLCPSVSLGVSLCLCMSLYVCVSARRCVIVRHCPSLWVVVDHCDSLWLCVSVCLCVCVCVGPPFVKIKKPPSGRWRTPPSLSARNERWSWNNVFRWRDLRCEERNKYSAQLYRDSRGMSWNDIIFLLIAKGADENN